MRVISFGELLWDVCPTRRTIGGAPLNFAAHAARCGMQAQLLSGVGRDALGDAAMDRLHSLGVDTSLVLRCDRPTGQCTVTQDEYGAPHYTVHTDAAYDHIFLDDASLCALQADALYFGTLAQRAPVSRDTLRRLLAAGSFREILCDLNLRDGCYDEDSVERCLRSATILKYSEEELPRLLALEGYDHLAAGGAAALFAHYAQLRVILYTRGAEGAVIYTRDGRAYTIPAVPTSVTSPVGAGDSFGAVWLSRRLSGDDEATAGAIAARVSSLVVASEEAVPMYDIAAFINH